MFILSIIALAFAFFSAGAFAEGIYCFTAEESTGCPNMGSDFMQDISNVIVSQIDPSRFYNNNEFIACGGASVSGEVYMACAFAFDSKGVLGSEIAEVIPDLVSYGCPECGGVAIGYPQSQDVTKGQIMVNVQEFGCDGEVEAGPVAMCP